METENIDEIISNAKTSFHKNKYSQAIQGFEYAYQHYNDIGDELNAAEMANNLSVALIHNRKAKEALAIVDGTDKVFEKHQDKVKQAMAIGNKGSALEALKRFDEAIEAYTQSIALFDEAGEKELRSYVYKSLSALHLKKGDNFKSIYAMQQSINAKENLSLKDRIVRFFLQIPGKLFSR